MGGFRQLLKIVTPRAAYGGAALFALSVSGIALATMLYPIEKSMIESLKFNRVTQGPVLDGEPDEDVWRQAQPVTIHTTEGANLPGSEVKVRVRGVRDDNHAYLLFEWQDATRSQKHLPLIKTADGWKVLESQYAINDENGYYEDKFAVMLSRTSKIGGGATQMGPKPLGDKPAPSHGRGLHYTTDGSIVDVWHWKSVRTGPLQQLDDNHFGPPLAEKQGERYTGGYTQDPKTGGGFEQNWKKIEGSDFVHPKRLPRDLDALQERMGAVDLSAGAGDAGQLWMKLAETVPYSKELDTYPVGTVIPSVLIDKPFEGDRGDVAGAATWKDGWWRLETRRKLTRIRSSTCRSTTELISGSRCSTTTKPGTAGIFIRSASTWGADRANDQSATVALARALDARQHPRRRTRCGRSLPAQLPQRGVRIVQVTADQRRRDDGRMRAGGPYRGRACDRIDSRLPVTAAW